MNDRNDSLLLLSCADNLSLIWWQSYTYSLTRKANAEQKWDAVKNI